jgi:hypothetical protein
MLRHCYVSAYVHPFVSSHVQRKDAVLATWEIRSQNQNVSPQRVGVKKL